MGLPTQQFANLNIIMLIGIMVVASRKAIKATKTIDERVVSGNG